MPDSDIVIHYYWLGGGIEQLLSSNHVLMYTEINTPKHFHSNSCLITA